MGIAAIGQINFSPATAKERHFGDSTKQTIGDIMRSGDVTGQNLLPQEITVAFFFIKIDRRRCRFRIAGEQISINRRAEPAISSYFILTDNKIVSPPFGRAMPTAVAISSIEPTMPITGAGSIA